MTLKAVIYDVLNETGLPVAYRHTNVSEMPRFNYSLIYNGELRLSGRTHTKKPSYQIDYFSNVPVDVESFDLFDTIRNQLREQQLAVGNWQETDSYDKETDTSIYHYYLECER